MPIPQQVDTETLRNWLESGKNITILDIRPLTERMDWYIPGSIHMDVYEKLKQKDPSVFDAIAIDPSIPVVAVCAAGKTSQTAALLLSEKGYNAYSLTDGMKGWSLAWNQALISFDDYKIIQLRRTGKGCLSYIIASGNDAVVIDASLPVEVYENILQQNGYRLKAVLETHIHADHLSRSKQLADYNKVKLYLPQPNKVIFEHSVIQNDSTFLIGNIPIKAIDTPGHTIESVSLLLNNEVLFTGDTLFTNSIGRPDLKASTADSHLRAGLLYESLQSILKLENNILVLPAHTSAPVDFDNQPVMATIGEIRNSVTLLKLSKQDFVETILARLPEPPTNYLTIVERNLAGDFSAINPIELEAGANRCAVS